MRKVVLSALLLATMMIHCKLKDDYTNKIELNRTGLISYYARQEYTPLDSNEFMEFKGLDFFPISRDYLTSGQIIWLPQIQFIQLSHTGGDSRPYMRVAEIHFKFNNISYSLSAFQNEQLRMNRKLFVPFTDLTNGKTSYSGGRYLDVVYAPQSNICEVDFNYAYAPACAHAHSFSCPIVPDVNRMNIEIPAGEKIKQ